MGKGLPRSHSRGEALKQDIIRQTFVAKDLALTVAGAAGVGFGSAVLGGLPEGNILLLGATSYLTFTGPISGSLDDDWQGDYGIGSAPVADADLGDASDDDFIPSTAIGAATVEVSPRTRGASGTTEGGTILDNTDGSLELNVNLLVDDADIGADGLVFTVDGELHIAYIVLGDD